MVFYVLDLVLGVYCCFFFVLGESSPPETSLQYQSNDCIEDFNSDAELSQIHHATPQQRSATIGADTPPVVSKSSTSQAFINRSDTLGASNQRETNLDGANSSDPTQTGDGRRESIEGQRQDRDLHALVMSVRDLTVGENPTDATPTNSNQEARKPKPESESDSDHEHIRGKSPRDSREHRYKDKNESRDKYRRERYSPDSFRERKVDKRRYRDRRYEDDTEDYFSDRERDRRRQERDKRDDYERKYASLRRDKEKDRRRREPKDGRRDYYYNRYQDDYEDNSRSRPSSRSDSMHDSYHERSHEQRRHREQPPRRHREREPFNPYMQVHF